MHRKPSSLPPVALTPVLRPASCSQRTPSTTPPTHGQPIDVSRLQIRSETMPREEALFRSDRSPWRGADGCATVPLAPGRTLWLFGDTWMKPDGSPGRKGGAMINNSLALQTWDAKGPRPPELYWSTDPTSGPVSALLPQGGQGFLWPFGGILLQGQLFVFTLQVATSREEILLTRALFLIVRNPEAAPAQWRIEQVEVPYFSGVAGGYTYFCGSAFVRDVWVYQYGVREDSREGGTGRSLLLARIPEDAYVRADFSAWRFYSGRDWSPDLHQAQSLFDGVASEFSVSWLPSLQAYVAVHSCKTVPGEIAGRLSPQPEGPWSDPVVLFRCQDENWDARYLYYAGKAHPELAAADNELILTYATNGAQVEDVVNDERLYWPRFVRVTIDKR